MNGHMTENKQEEDTNQYRALDDYLARRPLKTVNPTQRITHYLIDLVCFYLLTFCSLVVLGAIAISVKKPIDYENENTALIIQIITTLLFPVYYFFCESIWQKTPGKFFTKTIVIDEYGGKPSFKQMVLRSVSRLVPFEGFSCLGSDQSYGWHDRWSDTFVVPLAELEAIEKLLAEQEEKI